MSLPGFDQLTTFLLVWIRCLTFFAIGPLWSSRRIPPQIKVLAATATSLALYPILAPGSIVLERTLLGFGLLVGREIFLGALLGLVAGFVFAGIQFAGELMGVQMGFSIATVIDPASGEVSFLGQVLESVAFLLFLVAEGHHHFLRALAFSLEKVPPGGFPSPEIVMVALVPMAATVFIVAIEVGAPMLAALFLTDAALGFVARAVPQINIFILGIPIKIAVGIFLMIVTAPLFARLLTLYTSRLEGQLLLLLSGM